MRILPALWARGNPKEPVPFQEILPLKLRPFVSGKGDKTSNVCCLYEMSLVFGCLKENEFKESACGREIKSFQECFTNYNKQKYITKEREAKGILTPGEKRLPYRQLNKLLRMYPNEK
ncbi:hypothetical protein PPYR_03784 [Photinus pyralis]|uniref:CHCH domain-containing protein n=1 Tax=Photinus pyralis TaxID=7054 RepID=A0A1Y1NFK9_PHOPY|nr:hypothetical protein PPYR_03781 [Photinus pyralis]KAB0801598.1 hypothetical protein PPYR_03784 [Photinus pyralis]